MEHVMEEVVLEAFDVPAHERDHLMPKFSHDAAQRLEASHGPDAPCFAADTNLVILGVMPDGLDHRPPCMRSAAFVGGAQVWGLKPGSSAANELVVHLSTARAVERVHSASCLLQHL